MPPAATGGGGDRPVAGHHDQVLRPQPWTDTLQALGTVKARESITVTAKVSEIVQQVHFDSGDVVGKGAPLVTLSGQQQQAALRRGRRPPRTKPSSCSAARTNSPRSS